MGVIDEGKYYAFCTLITRSTLSADIGKTVRLTGQISGKVYTKVLDANQKAVFQMLENREKYTVEVVSNPGDSETVEFTDTILMGFGECKEMIVGADKSTFAGIQQILNLHKETEMLEIGDEISITLKTGNIPMTYQVAAINHDSKYAHQVIFTPKWCLPTTRQMNSSNTNVGGWNSAALRTWLNGTFLTDYLPDDVAALIAERDVICSQGNQSTALQTAVDKIWLPREYEIFGATTYATATEHTGGGAEQFPIFAVAANRIKTTGQGGSAYAWWESSPYASSATSFCAVNSTGAANSIGAITAYGVAPCFHMLADD